MSNLQYYSKEIVAILVPILIWSLNKIFEPKSKLAWSVFHSFIFLIHEPLFNDNGQEIAPSYTVKTGSIMIKNIGNTTLEKVEIMFNWKPVYNIWPIRHYQGNIAPDGRYIMFFENLSRNESIQIEVLEKNGNRELPSIVNVRCKECFAKQILMTPQEVVENWKKNTAKILQLIGVGAAVYILIILFQFMITRP